MKKYILYILLLLTAIDNTTTAQQSKPTELKRLLEQFKNPTKDYVLVAAHRGDWRNAPENSIRSTKNSIDMGVDIVETDVRKTKDGILVIMHDETLDRTTTGKGKVEDVTLDSLSKLYLRNGAGHSTHYKIPTLEELMLLVKGKCILVNLDKSWDCIPQTYAVLKKTGTLNQGIFKGYETLAEMRKKIGALLDSIMYMPMIRPQEQSNGIAKLITPTEFAKAYTESYKPVAFEVVLGKQESTSITSAIKIIQAKKTTVWMNTLWADLCASHDDDLAIDDPDANWGWVISRGANVIQTDRPAMMLQYLRKRGLHK